MESGKRVRDVTPSRREPLASIYILQNTHFLKVVLTRRMDAVPLGVLRCIVNVAVGSSAAATGALERFPRRIANVIGGMISGGQIMGMVTVNVWDATGNKRQE